MKNLSLVAAIGRSNELGLDNHLLWKIKEDLMFYRNLTMHHNIIMGRKTLESMPIGALKGRNPFVLSSRNLDRYIDVNSFTSLSSLLSYIEISGDDFIVVGGTSIYKAFLPYVDTMYLTEIDENTEADTFFPNIDIHDWCVETIFDHYRDYKHPNDISYMRNKYVRRRVK